MHCLGWFFNDPCHKGTIWTMVVQLKICWAYILRWGGIPGKTPWPKVGEVPPNLTWRWYFWLLPQRKTVTWSTSRMWFQIFCSPRKLGRWTHFDEHSFQMGLVQPPPRHLFEISLEHLFGISCGAWSGRMESGELFDSAMHGIFPLVGLDLFSWWFLLRILPWDFSRHFHHHLGNTVYWKNHMFFLENHIFIDGCFFHLQS